MEQRNFGYGHERHTSGAQGSYFHGESRSPESSKRSVRWPFSGSISTTNSPLEGSEPTFPTHSSILRRYASNRSAAGRFHRKNPSSISRSRGNSGSTGLRGIRHGASSSISTIRTVASSSTLFPVPDYVANYIRGETPESIARRREERARMDQERFPDIREGSMDIEEGPEPNAIGEPADRDAQPTEDAGKRTCIPSGWRATTSLSLLLAVLMTIASVVATAITAIKLRDTFWSSESHISTKSSCRAIRQLNQGAHGAAAALGVLLVAGAGHAAQVLSAPSRNDVDKAHQDGRYLDVGRGLSVRNFKAVSMWRVLVALLVIMAATVTLVLINALLFTTTITGSPFADLKDLASKECSLTLDGALLGVILIFLVLTTGSLIVTLALPTPKPLLTIGDAIASFASRADPSVRHSTGSAVEDITGRNTPTGQALVGNQDLRRARWMSTVSIARWVSWTITWTVPFALALAGLVLSITNTDDAPRFTLSRPHWIVESAAGSSRTALVILASLPQVLVAVLYLSTSGLLTAFFSARELGGYDAAAKAAAEEGGVVRLRVSSASEGMQTTSMYATLPPFVSVLLWAFFAAVGFLVSQSLGLVAIDGPSGQEVTGLGLNPLALMIVSALLMALGFATLAMSIFCQSAVAHNSEGTRTISSLCRSWSASREVEEMREQPQTQPSVVAAAAATSAAAGRRTNEPWQGDRVVSWAVSEAQVTISSGRWMAAGR